MLPIPTYEYALSNPLTLIDIYGLEVWYKDGVTPTKDKSLRDLLNNLDKKYPGYSVRVSETKRSKEHSSCKKKRLTWSNRLIPPS